MILIILVQPYVRVRPQTYALCTFRFVFGGDLIDFCSVDTGERGGFIFEEYELDGIARFFTEIKSIGCMDLSCSLLL